MKSVEVPSFSVTVYVAGSVADAETGVAVGLVHYQRFPSSPEAIWDRAKTIAETLMDDLYQHSAMIVGPERTLWISRKPEVES